MASEHAEVALAYAKNHTGASAKKHNDINNATLPRSGLVQVQLCCARHNWTLFMISRNLRLIIADAIAPPF
jgi:hypothetical protein